MQHYDYMGATKSRSSSETSLTNLPPSDHQQSHESLDHPQSSCLSAKEGKVQSISTNPIIQYINQLNCVYIFAIAEQPCSRHRHIRLLVVSQFNPQQNRRLPEGLRRTTMCTVHTGLVQACIRINWKVQHSVHSEEIRPHHHVPSDVWYGEPNSGEDPTWRYTLTRIQTDRQLSFIYR